MAKKKGQNEGTISKRTDGTWWGRITVGRNDNGTQKRKAFYGKTRQEVQKKITAALSDLDKGTYVEPSKIIFLDWLDIWLETYKKSEIKPMTYINYRAKIKNHIKPLIGKYRLNDLRIDIIQDTINKLSSAKKLSPETVRGIYNIIHDSLNKAVKNGLIIKNVAIDITLPKIMKKEIRVFTVAEQERFIEEAKKVYAGEMFIFDLGTGLRIGELLGLTWSDVNFDEEIIRVKRTLNIVKDFDDSESKWHKEFGSPKTESSNRSIPLLPDLVTLLCQIRQKQKELIEFVGSAYEDNNLIFATQLGKPLDPRNMQRTFKVISDKSNITGATIHSCRHTFATRGLENGIELRVMQELLGHASIKMTADLYTHVLPDKKRDSIMKLSGTIKI